MIDASRLPTPKTTCLPGWTFSLQTLSLSTISRSACQRVVLSPSGRVNVAAGRGAAGFGAGGGLGIVKVAGLAGAGAGPASATAATKGAGASRVDPDVAGSPPEISSSGSSASVVR